MPEFAEGAEVAHDAKRATRIELLARRRARTEAERAAAAARLRAELASLVNRLRPGRIAAYAPVGGEPGGSELPTVLAEVLPAGADLLLPVLRDDLDLDWAAWDGPQAIIAAGRGIREPTGPRLGVTAVATADLVVVPALAVDRRGIRLGRGGGSYDRALARVPATVLTVVPLYDGELLSELPAEPHDLPVRAVVTPTDGLLTLAGVVPHTSAGRTGGR
ncbi:5-formyltetrahydrofolate cyclo-ligase [Verrucosispora sp. CWR15]|uniref:5-formyltetrahydrofolate cyclo-ligase n=1 Tax=Verrucosispora sioxanthis TaxID=2499994 RepID=A0A6M1KUC3_9ACTN|nr:5-formyltetrahydrofolate cyclo-ligase [Verrucosispora sioxanthis]NEE63216.1 5-formyltetrahydrofolate cyclo-ligase [Verrucosispora sioxanthis]NGM12326.1 5-formyltetrahydrofolate cyclo-ligase [Verrucosispora sioxanthis]